MVNVRTHKDLVGKIFEKYDLPLDCYEIVTDIDKWCISQEIFDDNPYRQAKCLCRWGDGPSRIVFREEQTDDMISSSKAAMECNGFASEVEKLDSDVKYLEHLVLHEIACHILRTTEQNPRDEWAFKKMGILPCKAMDNEKHYPKA